MKKPLKFLIVVTTLIVSYRVLTVFCESQTQCFSMMGISSDLPFNPDWDTPPPEENLTEVFQQKFHYLNSGGQSFAFLSEDGKTVIKFFKLYRRRLAPGWDLLPLPKNLDEYRQKSIKFKKGKLDRDFNSYVMAYNELRKESGLIYLHLNKTDYLKQNITIVDPLGIEHTFDLDSKEFLVQKRVILAYDAIDELMKLGKVEESKQKIDALLALIMQRYQKGFYDDDAFINKNYGFVGDEAILLDVGRFQKRDDISKPEVYKNDLRLITDRFKLWLDAHHPALSSYLITQREALIHD